MSLRYGARIHWLRLGGREAQITAQAVLEGCDGRSSPTYKARFTLSNLVPPNSSSSIMDLMHLPPELLCQIIDLAVPEHYFDGLYRRSAVNLRLVNRKYFQCFESADHTNASARLL